jgi:hypothetical protein
MSRIRDLSMSDDVTVWINLSADVPREEFARRYPFAFLVSEGSVGAPAQRAFKTMVGNVSSGQSPASDKPPRVWAVVKSERNRFPHMITMGRADNNDIVLEPLSVSKFHAYFALDAKKNEYSITDAESKFGTFVADKKLHPSSPHPLASGDVVQIGKEARLTFYRSEEFYEYVKILKGMGRE